MKPVTQLAEITPRKRVLLLDDDPSVRHALASVLLSENYHVICAGSDTEVLGRLASDPVDIALIDLNGAGESRWRLVEQVGEARPRPAIVLLTANPERLQHPSAVLAQGWCQKPLLDLPSLFGQLAALCAPRPAETGM